MKIIPSRFFVGGSLARCRGGDSRAQLRTCNPCRPPLKRHAPPTCHSEERSDVGISGRQLRFRRWLSHDPAGYCEIATSAYGLLAMTNRGASTVLTAACTNRQFIAGRGQPGPYNKCMRSAMACATCECLPEIAPQGHFLALRAQGATGAERPRNDKFLAHFAK